MKNLLYVIGGAVVGSVVTFFVTKNVLDRKYDKIYQEEVDEYKEHVKDKIANDPEFVESIKRDRKARQEKMGEKDETLEENDILDEEERDEYLRHIANYEPEPEYEDDENDEEEEDPDLAFYVGSMEPEPLFDKNAVPQRVTEEYADYCELELEYDVVLYKWRIGEAWLSTYDNDTIELEELFEERVDILFKDVAEGDTIYIADDSVHILYTIVVNP